MKQRSPSWKGRCLAAVLAVALSVAGVGVAVAGQSGPVDPPPPLSVDTPPVDPPATVSSGGTESTADSDGTAGAVAAPSPPATGTTLSEATVPPAAPDALTEKERSSPRSVSSPSSHPSLAPPTTSTTVDVRRLFDERVGSVRDDGTEGEGLTAELEIEVRACVATLVDEVGSSFEGQQPDAERIQVLASDVVDEVLACVAGLVDVGQVLNCVSGVIQEILAVVMSMDFTNMPQLVNEIADDMVTCVSP